MILAGLICEFLERNAVIWAGFITEVNEACAWACPVDLRRPYTSPWDLRRDLLLRPSLQAIGKRQVSGSIKLYIHTRQRHRSLRAQHRPSRGAPLSKSGEEGQWPVQSECPQSSEGLTVPTKLSQSQSHPQ